MVFYRWTIGIDGFQWFPMVANHWSNDGMVTIHRYGLVLAVRGKIEAYQVLDILQRLRHGVELVCQPEISEADIEERSQDYSCKNSEKPEPGLMLECLGGVEHENDHKASQGEWNGVCRDVQLRGVEEGEDRSGPNHPKYCR